MTHVVIGSGIVLFCAGWVALTYFVVPRVLFSPKLLDAVPAMTEENFLLVILLWLVLAAVYVLVFVAWVALLELTMYVVPPLVLLGVVSIVGGAALSSRRRWSIVLLRASACVYLLLFPVGTFLGVVTLWNLRRGVPEAPSLR